MRRQTWEERFEEHWCTPGCHDLVPEGTGQLRCLICDLRSHRSLLTCLICGAPATLMLARRRPGGPSRVVGGLCGPCLNEYAVRGSVPGWRQTQAL